jgi:hypothetical protein
MISRHGGDRRTADVVQRPPIMVKWIIVTFDATPSARGNEPLLPGLFLVLKTDLFRFWTETLSLWFETNRRGRTHMKKLDITFS